MVITYILGFLLFCSLCFNFTYIYSEEEKTQKFRPFWNLASVLDHMYTWLNEEILKTEKRGEEAREPQGTYELMVLRLQLETIKSVYQTAGVPVPEKQT